MRFLNSSVSSDLNRSFGSLLVLLVMATTGTLCCAAVFCLTQGVGAEFLEYVAFLPTVVGQYFMICYYGQQLIIKVDFFSLLRFIILVKNCLISRVKM